jgi:hypothetical protein
MYLSLDVFRWTLHRTPVGSLEHAVLCCALFTKPYHSNGGAVLLRVCVVMRMLLRSNEHLQISTVADRLSMFATSGRIPWEALTSPPHGDWCLGGEAYGKTDMASGACSFGCWKRWWYFRCCGWGCDGGRFESSGSTVVLVEYVSRLDPVGRHGDGFAAHKEF